MPETTHARRPPKRNIEEAMKLVRSEVDARLKRKDKYLAWAVNRPDDEKHVKYCERMAVADERAAERLIKVWVWMGDACNV
jgi:hypothetical protein